jgi:BlaI family transcriptional regulator, penicillinase repressor
MARTAKDVTEAELTILRVLWDEGPLSVRDIVASLRDHPSSPQAATVQKLLERLEDKGWVTRDRSGSVQMFAATADRDDLIGQRLRGIADDLCEGSVTPLLSQLVNNAKLSAADRQLLRELIDRFDESPKRKRS